MARGVVWEARGRGGGQELLGDKFSSIEQGSSESRSLLTQRPRMRDESMTTEEVEVQEEEERRKGRRGRRGGEGSGMRERHALAAGEHWD